jgi:hypothetical protein
MLGLSEFSDSVSTWPSSCGQKESSTVFRFAGYRSPDRTKRSLPQANNSLNPDALTAARRLAQFVMRQKEGALYGHKRGNEKD